MAVKLRLMRMGKKKHPTYRVVAADSRSPRDGRFIELIGRYDPHPHPSVVEIDNERALHWLEVGAQPTDAVRKLLEISGAWGQFRVKRGDVHVVGDVAPPEAHGCRPRGPDGEPTRSDEAGGNRVDAHTRAAARGSTRPRPPRPRRVRRAGSRATPAGLRGTAPRSRRPRPRAAPAGARAPDAGARCAAGRPRRAPPRPRSQPR